MLNESVASWFHFWSGIMRDKGGHQLVCHTKKLQIFLRCHLYDVQCWFSHCGDSSKIKAYMGIIPMSFLHGPSGMQWSMTPRTVIKVKLVVPFNSSFTTLTFWQQSSGLPGIMREFWCWLECWLCQSYCICSKQVQTYLLYNFQLIMIYNDHGEIGQGMLCSCIVSMGFTKYRSIGYLCCNSH